MPDERTIVINTGPIIALVAAMGDFTVLKTLYQKVLIPFEVVQEISAGGKNAFAKKEFEAASWIQKWPAPVLISPLLANSLDQGEAAVIQLALDQHISTVCIDETVGRRFARLSGLKLTGSVGILIKAKQEGHLIDLKKALVNMREKGVWLSDELFQFVLKFDRSI